ncbi:MAG TPA: bacterioferritin [Rhizomicrobium sp.]|jgi:bacterioferritin|nr:bacterioferritin [Rhizomicrobium sp.]
MPGNNRKNAGRRQGRPSPAGSGGVAPGPEPHASIAGDPETIRWLNVILKNELTAINQYFLHSRMLADWGLSQLAKHEYEESIDEMKHADALIKRILFLGGLPNLQDLGKLMIGEDVQEVITCDLSLEMQSYPDLKNAVVHCENARDFGSRELFVHILESEEEHIDYLQTQLRLIEQMGIQNYVQLQTKANDSGT